MNPFRSDCDAVRDTAIAHIEGDTSTLEALRFRRHLDACHDCHQIVDEIASMVTATKREPFLPSPECRDRIFQQTMAAIAAAPSKRGGAAPSSRKFSLLWARPAVLIAASLLLTLGAVLFAISREQMEPRGDAPLRSAESPLIAALPSDRFENVHPSPGLSLGASQDARWRLSDSDTEVAIVVAQGRLWIRLDNARAEKNLRIEGSGVAVTVVGTVLVVDARAGSGMAVGVLQGSVEIESAFGERRLVEEGGWRTSEGAYRRLPSQLSLQGAAWLGTLDSPGPAPAAPDSIDDTEGGVLESAEEPPAGSERGPGGVEGRGQPRGPLLYRQAEDAMDKGRYRRAAELLEQLIRLNGSAPESDIARLDLAAIYVQRLKKPEKAAHHLGAYLRRHPAGGQARLVKRRLCDLRRRFNVSVTTDCPE